MSKVSIADEDFNYSDFAARTFDEQDYLDESVVSSSHSHDRTPNVSSELFSDLVLDYISQILLDEDVDDKYDMLQDHPDLEATEKPFYDIIGENYPSSPDQPPIYSSSSSESPDRNPSCNSGSTGIRSFLEAAELPESQDYQISFSPSSHSSDNCGEISLNGLELYGDRITDPYFETLPTIQFEKGIEEARKFLPSEANVTLNVGEIDLSSPHDVLEKERKFRNRHFYESGYEDEGRIKQSAVSYEEPVIPSEMFDNVLLCNCETFPQVVNAIREKMYGGFGKGSENSNPDESRDSRKFRRKKQQKQKVVDTNALLLNCAQNLASGDSLRAHELLRQIRQHSSPVGDASQRLAHYFADGLEARLTGIGSDVYRSLALKRRTIGDVLKAYQLYLVCCPFKKISYHFANETILSTIQNAARIHILDFGIYFGFQWPIFIKMLSDRPGGPPKLRITGIDIPEPGFRPTERIEKTGRLLADYAKRFGVPFEYHAVAAKFDEVKREDLHIEEDEMLIANCLFRLHTPADETVMVDCPRDKVLNTIRNLNPSVFVNAVVNGSFGAPFFMTRFREALYHYSAVFDMLDSTAPRENEVRMLVERHLYGSCMINVIACEGTERERPETYKQWQVRILRAGFEQLPINKEFARKVKEGVKILYHKDFIIDEDGRWLLQGWKGRIFFGLSAWRPKFY